MSVDNVKPTTALSPKATVEEPPDLVVPVDEQGRTRVWLRHNVLGGRAGTWHWVLPSHPELPRLIEMNAVAVPDPVTGELLPPPARPARRCGSCR